MKSERPPLNALFYEAVKGTAIRQNNKWGHFAPSSAKLSQNLYSFVRQRIAGFSPNPICKSVSMQRSWENYL